MGRESSFEAKRAAHGRRGLVPPPAPPLCPRFDAEKLAGHHDPASAEGMAPSRAGQIAVLPSARKSGTPAPAPAGKKDGTILNPSLMPIPQNRMVPRGSGLIGQSCVKRVSVCFARETGPLARALTKHAVFASRGRRLVEQRGVLRDEHWTGAQFVCNFPASVTGIRDSAVRAKAAVAAKKYKRDQFHLKLLLH